MGKPDRVWTIPAIHSDIGALIRIHDNLLERVRPGERILYHGNYTGYGADAAACIEEILTFRRMVLAMPGMITSDLVYLRGQQEQILQQLLQLQFNPDPTNALLWMLGNGISETLYSYGISPHDGIDACRQGVMAITKWTNSIRSAIRQHPGHETFFNQLKRAGHTHTDSAHPLLFVHAGLSAHKPLNEQGENLWWGAEEFEQITAPYQPFAKVVRGFDPVHRGAFLNCVTATVDDACGFGGNLISVGFDADGVTTEILEA